MRRRILRVQFSRSRELLLGLFEIAGLEVGHAQVVTESRIARPARNRLLPQQDGVAQLTRIQFFQQLLARLGWSRILRLRGRGRRQQAE